jgi:hypothetical protein
MKDDIRKAFDFVTSMHTDEDRDPFFKIGYLTAVLEMQSYLLEVIKRE